MKINKKILKLAYVFILTFILINIILQSQVFGFTGPTTKFGATVFKWILVISQITLAGWFTFKAMIVGIRYFMGVSTSAGNPQEQAELRNNFKTLLYFALPIYIIVILILRFVGF